MARPPSCPNRVSRPVILGGAFPPAAQGSRLGCGMLCIILVHVARPALKGAFRHGQGDSLEDPVRSLCVHRQLAAQADDDDVDGGVGSGVLGSVSLVRRRGRGGGRRGMRALCRRSRPARGSRRRRASARGRRIHEAVRRPAVARGCSMGDDVPRRKRDGGVRSGHVRDARVAA